MIVLLKIFKQIFTHPLNKGREFKSLGRFIKWQLYSRLYPYPILLPFTDKSSYLCWNGLTGLTGNWYYGLMEMEEMAFSVHFLRDEDTFFDIGANVGAYSILASQHSKAVVHAFEPHPTTFEHLKKNIAIQLDGSNVFLHNIGLGSSQETLAFTANHDTVNHVATSDEGDTIEVRIETLDKLKIAQPSLIKIDIEGFEFQALTGSHEILSNKKLKAVIIEINGSGRRYGIEDEQIDDLLRSYGFSPYNYDPVNRVLVRLKTFRKHNTIYARDIESINQRTSTAQKFILSNGVSL